jgi:hypothetical protein
VTSDAVELEATYYRTVEEFFVERRGPPLTISNADWTLVRRWRKAGLPLRVVLRGIQDALDAHAHSFARQHPVGSLRYCEAEVDLARERWQQALSGGGPGEVEVGAALERLAESCQAAAPALTRPLRARALALAAELRDRATDVASRLDLETWLAAQEADLVKRLRRATPGQQCAAIEAEIEADLAPYRERLPPAVLGQVRADSFARRLLELYGLPRVGLLNI